MNKLRRTSLWTCTISHKSTRAWRSTWPITIMIRVARVRNLTGVSTGARSVPRSFPIEIRCWGICSLVVLKLENSRTRRVWNFQKYDYNGLNFPRLFGKVYQKRSHHIVPKHVKAETHSRFWYFVYIVWDAFIFLFVLG